MQQALYADLRDKSFVIVTESSEIQVIRIDNLLPQALGMVKLRIKSSELPVMKARDRWEGSNFAEEFTFEVLEKYFKEPYLISATAKLTILLALINRYGFEEVEERAKMMPDQIIFGL